MRNGAETFRRAFPQARSLWEATIPGPQGREYRHLAQRLEAFSLGRTIVVIHDYMNGNGWNVFVPATDNGRIDETLKAIAVRAGVEEPDTSEFKG